MNVSKILTVFTIISIFCIVVFCDRYLKIYVHGTPECLKDRSGTTIENVTATLENKKHRKTFPSVTGLCNQKISVSQNVYHSSIENNDLSITYYYNKSHYNNTKIIRKDCDKGGVINRHNFICDFITKGEKYVRDLCRQLIPYANCN